MGPRATDSVGKSGAVPLALGGQMLDKRDWIGKLGSRPFDWLTDTLSVTMEYSVCWIWLPKLGLFRWTLQCPARTSLLRESCLWFWRWLSYSYLGRHSPAASIAPVDSRKNAATGDAQKSRDDYHLRELFQSRSQSSVTERTRGT